MEARGAAREQTREVLVFVLGGEEYGVDILKVQEIRGYEKVTPIPAAPDYLKGVVNLRGIIVPVIDMRVKFRLADPRYDAFTVVIILRIGGRVIGIVVDGVSDVVRLAPSEVKPPPAALASSRIVPRRDPSRTKQILRWTRSSSQAGRTAKKVADTAGGTS